jgi:hypothetical protein
LADFRAQKLIVLFPLSEKRGFNPIPVNEIRFYLKINEVKGPLSDRTRIFANCLETENVFVTVHCDYQRLKIITLEKKLKHYFHSRVLGFNRPFILFPTGGL